MSDVISPAKLLGHLSEIAQARGRATALAQLARGVGAGLVLAAATAVAHLVVVQGAPAFVGALVFPVGFVILSLQGYELATGNFALLPSGMRAGTLTLRRLLRNWAMVYTGNFLGALAFALLYILVITHGGGSAVNEKIVTLATAKVTPYELAGMAGFLVAFVKGALCNWLVTTAVFLGVGSTSTLGKTGLVQTSASSCRFAKFLMTLSEVCALRQPEGMSLSGRRDM